MLIKLSLIGGNFIIHLHYRIVEKQKKIIYINIKIIKIWYQKILQLDFSEWQQWQPVKVSVFLCGTVGI